MKKNLLLVAFAFIIVGIKAQTAAIEFPAETVLTEKSINKILDESRKKGIKEFEIEMQNKGLHRRMQQQKANYALGNGSAHKTIVTPPQVNSSGCVNPGFENGTNSNWSLFSGNINSVNLPCNTCANSPGGISNVVNSTSTITGQCTSGSDYYGSFPVVAPSGGNYSLLLNNAASGGKMMRASYSFVVTNLNDIFTFQYAVVLQSGSHLPNEQPYFHVDVTDNTTNATVPCTQYDAVAPASGAAQGWSLSPLDNTVSYKPWTTVGLDLQSAVGHTVTVNFIVSDCIYGGHFGYCYIDADCGNPASASNVAGFCGTTTGNVTMTGPSGYTSYQWYGPAPNYNTPIAGATTQTLSTTASINDTFLVKGTFASGCVSSFRVIVTASGINLSTSSSSTCKGGSNGSASVVVGGSGGSFNYVWTGSSGAIGTNTATINSLAAGTYSVHVTDATGGCPAKDTIVKVLAINPTLQTTIAQLCGTQTSLTAPNGSLYQWYDTLNAQTGVTTQTYNIAHGVNGQHYTVTYKNPNTQCEDSIRVTLNQTTISFVPQKTNPCTGGNSGSLTFNASPNNTYSTYDWSITGGTTGSASNATPPYNFPNLAAGTYTMIISVPGNTSCFYLDTVTLINTGAISVTTDPNHNVCTTDNLVLNSGAPASSTNSWTGTGLTYGANTAATLTVNTAFTNTVTNFYTYTDTIKSSQGCKSIYIATVKVKSFTAKMSVVEPIHCYRDSTGKLKTSVSAEKNGPIGTPDTYTFTWLPTAAFTGTNPVTANGASASSVKGGNLKAGTYTCVVTNGNCIETAVITLVSPLPLHTDSLYAYYCPKDSLALLIADTGNLNYVWHPSNVGASVTGDTIHVPVQDVNNYYVTYLRNGCADTAKTIISVTTYDAFRPNELVNVFSPNGDKTNDFFYPFYQQGVSQYQIKRQSDTYELHIYDRWGKSVYDATDYAKPWDGKTKSGHDADNGSYFFIVKYKSNCGSKADLVEKKGFVELVR
jgi:gliding motility-associated-like protein